MNPNIVAALIGGGTGLVGAIVGGIITARATAKATKRANDLALRLKQQEHDTVVRGVLLGLHAEISTLWGIYSNEFGAVIEELKEGKEFTHIYPLYQNYFAVYESNASLFGQIPDDNLRKAIVTTYLRARGLIDTHLYINQLIEQQVTLRRLRDETGNINIDQQITTTSEDLRHHSKLVKANYFEMKTRVADLTEQIDRYLNRS